MLMSFLLVSMVLVALVLILFFLFSKKSLWEIGGSSSFECGFSSYFFSRFSFSMHYFLIGLIFLFLDLELCFLMPFLCEEFSTFKLVWISWVFVMILILGIFYEWKQKKLDWIF